MTRASWVSIVTSSHAWAWSRPISCNWTNVLRYGFRGSLFAITGMTLLSAPLVSSSGLVEFTENHSTASR